MGKDQSLPMEKTKEIKQRFRYDGNDLMRRMARFFYCYVVTSKQRFDALFAAVPLGHALCHRDNHLANNRVRYRVDNTAVALTRLTPPSARQQ